MGVELTESEWLGELPVDAYLEKVRETAPERVTECPSDYTIGDLSVSCGPLVRFCAFDEEGQSNYRGTVMIVFRNFDSEVPKFTYAVGPKTDFSGLADGALEGEIIHREEEFTFIRYSFNLELTNYEQKVKYFISGTSLPHFQFVIPSLDQSMNVMSYSCNGFSLNVDTSEFKGSLWLDVLRRHNSRSYHVMIGGGDQIYADSIKTTSKEFEQWLKHRHLYGSRRLTDKMAKSFETYYLNHYIKWFGKGFWEGPNGKTIQSCYPLALASIPQINIYDDHDIIDGFGSYSDSTMNQDIFQGVGQYAFRYYMLFQHHTFYKEDIKLEKSFIGGAANGPYIKQQSRSIFAKLGANIAFLGLDCRTERTKKEIVTPETYKLVFDRLNHEISSSKSPIKHLYVLLGVPIMYPRMVWVEKLMESPLSRPVKFLARKGIVARGLVNEFDGEIELLDDLNDHWCALHHKRERNEFLAKLVKFGETHNTRISILSGDVHLCTITRLKSSNPKIALTPEKDPNFVINLISSAIVNTAPPEGMANFLKKRAIKHKFSDSAIEDTIPMFKSVDGANTLFMARRNYSDLIPIENLTDEERSQRYGSSAPDNSIFLPGDSSQLKSIEKNADSSTNGKIGYKYSTDSIVATLHVEDNTKDSKSSTSDFELFVPALTV